MTTALTLVCFALLGTTIWIYFQRRKIQAALAEQAQQLSALEQRMQAAQTDAEAQIAHAQAEKATAVKAAQHAVEQHRVEVLLENDRIKDFYDAELRKRQDAADVLVRKMAQELEPLRKFAGVADAEAHGREILEKALREATVLRDQARQLLEQSELTASEERASAVQKARQIRSEAEALMIQATRDAGKVVAAASKRAEEIAGDAYVALRDKQTLEQAVQALWNTANGYGDRYVIPTRSVLDDLAAEFGYTEAGEALRAAREHSCRMVEERQAATCNYVEDDRRDRANRFVVDAFNGRVDAILTRVKHDNYGTLEQEIRDSFSLVNLNGIAFRDARVLPAYLDARLAELKWAAVVQELRLKEREEQRRIREQMREEEKVRREIERAMRESEKEKGIISEAMERAQQQIAHATEQQKLVYEQQLQELSQRLKEAEERNQRALSMAQQTKLGHVYIISNIGSFGEGVFKIGMTRRIVPEDRILELSDSSVPFGFDIHALIKAEDAPALEAELHNHFVMSQLNKVNHRKEFFRSDLKQIRAEVEQLGLTAKWTMSAAAAEYRQTLAIEEAMRRDPSVRDAWVRRQFELEELDELFETIKTSPEVPSAEDSTPNEHENLPTPALP